MTVVGLTCTLVQLVQVDIAAEFDVQPCSPFVRHEAIGERGIGPDWFLNVPENICCESRLQHEHPS